MRAAIVALGVGVGLVPFSLVFASGSATVQALSSTNATVGMAVTFTVAASGFTNPSYSMSDSFNGGSNVPANLNTSTGTFSWTPQTRDIGEHDLTITVVDSQGDYASIVQTLYVNAAVSTSVGLSAVSPSTTVSPGSQVLFSATPTGFNSGITYAVSDSFSGSSVSSSNISNSGNFAWTPTGTDGGTHTITVTATDPSGHNASASVTIVVSQTPVVSVTNLSATTTVVGTPITFTATANGFSTTTPAFYAVTDYFGGSSLNSNAINA
ncbi:MAG TPA: putative Ig domain-containing protein, partial [Candidatus Paceibacterota bacterium]